MLSPNPWLSDPRLSASKTAVEPPYSRPGLKAVRGGAGLSASPITLAEWPITPKVIEYVETHVSRGCEPSCAFPPTLRGSAGLYNLIS